MKDEWKRRFNFSKQLYFGDLNDPDMLDAYYFEDKILEEKRILALDYINNKLDNSSILIGGDAGVGKSTFINNIIKKYISKELFYPVLLNVDNRPDDPFIKDCLAKDLKGYLFSLTDGELLGKKIISKFKHDYQAYISDELYLERNERINNIVSIINDLSAYLNKRKQEYPRLIIFLDQVERFGSETLTDFLSEYLGFIASSRHIKLVVCARKETIRSAKQSIKGFFSTYFKRFVEIDSPPIEKILQKRFHAGRGDIINLEEINKVFTQSFCDLLENISNNNIRVMLRIFEKIMESTIPYEGRDGYTHYFSFLLTNEYIEDLYKRINQVDSIPLIKIVFDGLRYYSLLDEKFYRVIKSKVMTIDRIKDIRGLTNENINLAIKHLLDNDFIIDSFDYKNTYSLTKKGMAYARFIELEGYSRLFAKNDEKFRKNIFTDHDFVK